MAASSNSKDDNALAYAAISLLGNEGRGATPEWQEISAWREGTLSEQRSAEILSHVANDPEFFQQWLDIADAEHWVEEQNMASASASPTALNEQLAEPLSDTGKQQPRSTSHSNPLSDALNWIRSFFDQPLKVYGGAFAAIAVAVLIVPLLRESDAVSLQQQMDRSLDTYIAGEAGLSSSPPVARSTRNLGGLFDDLSPADVSRQHFQYGMQLVAQQLQARDSEQWQLWSNDLASNPPECDKAVDQSHCSAATEDLTALGQWTLLNYVTCQQRSAFDSDQYWSLQLDLYKQFTDKELLSTNLVFGPLLTPLPSQTADSLCSIVSPLIAAGM
ncbi:MAG: hypothetical protein AB8B79_07770 [Granulosicoccus sp.]